MYGISLSGKNGHFDRKCHQNDVYKTNCKLFLPLIKKNCLCTKSFILKMSVKLSLCVYISQPQQNVYSYRIKKMTLQLLLKFRVLECNFFFPSWGWCFDNVSSPWLHVPASNRYPKTNNKNSTEPEFSKSCWINICICNIMIFSWRFIDLPASNYNSCRPATGKNMHSFKLSMYNVMPEGQY